MLLCVDEVDGGVAELELVGGVELGGVDDGGFGVVDECGGGEDGGSSRGGLVGFVGGIVVPGGM
ncbi:hypothetical protein GKO32_15335 [Amycolatopsis sp. RM579]|uniref:Uncharacterized protein n=1 Tax=Amycolatopsis pithecellobii TaxID=664692 RepID=A0A6N7Z4R2_9PSEU|nr:hypothetical protein [Amycolatopsis pithecellobii]